MYFDFKFLIPFSSNGDEKPTRGRRPRRSTKNSESLDVSEEPFEDAIEEASEDATEEPSETSEDAPEEPSGDATEELDEEQTEEAEEEPAPRQTRKRRQSSRESSMEPEEPLRR